MSLASSSEYCPFVLFVVIVFVVVVIEVAISSLVATLEVAVEDMFKYCLDTVQSSLNHGCSRHSVAEKRSLKKKERGY